MTNTETKVKPVKKFMKHLQQPPKWKEEVVELAKTLFSEEKPAKVMLEGVFTYGQLAQMDSDRLIRIILKLQQEN